MSRVEPVLSQSPPAIAGKPLRDEYLASVDLRGFVDRHRNAVTDPETAYYVSRALEECTLARDLDPGNVPDRCLGFGERATGQDIMQLLRHAASRGEPHARARMLLFRDVAAPKDDVLDSLPWMLTSRDAAIVRDIGAFLSRGEAHWRYGGEPVPVAIAAIAWDLAACDLDPRCVRHDDAIPSTDPPDVLAQAEALRAGITRAIRASDWDWIGIPATGG